MKRGEIHWAEFEPRSGSEPRGIRPALVFSSDALNGIPGWRSILVVPFGTSGKQARRGPTAVAIPAGASGLKGDSVALCHQLTTLDRSKFLGYIGVIAPTALQTVEDGIRAALDME